MVPLLHQHVTATVQQWSVPVDLFKHALLQCTYIYLSTENCIRWSHHMYLQPHIKVQ